MRETTRKIGQNIIILREALKEENMNKKISICKFTNDNGIYCNTDGLIKRLTEHKNRNDIVEMNRLIRHILDDLKVLRG